MCVCMHACTCLCVQTERQRSAQNILDPLSHTQTHTRRLGAERSVVAWRRSAAPVRQSAETPAVRPRRNGMPPYWGRAAALVISQQVIRGSS